MPSPTIPTIPTEFPDWATSLVTDPTSGQPNRATPSSGKKASGFLLNEKPPRQNQNWLDWLSGLWVRFFADSIDRPTYGRSSTQGLTHLAYSQKAVAKSFTLNYNINPALAAFALASWDGTPAIVAGSVAEIKAVMKITGSTDQIICHGILKLHNGNLASVLVVGNADSFLAPVRTVCTNPSYANNGNSIAGLVFVLCNESGTGRADLYLINNSGSPIIFDALFVDIILVPLGTV